MPISTYGTAAGPYRRTGAAGRRMAYQPARRRAPQAGHDREYGAHDGEVAPRARREERDVDPEVVGAVRDRHAGHGENAWARRNRLLFPFATDQHG